MLKYYQYIASLKINEAKRKVRNKETEKDRK